MAGLRGHFNSDTAAPPPPYSAQPNPYSTSSTSYNEVPAQQQGYSYPPPQQSSYNNPGTQAQPPQQAYPQPGERSPYLQPQNGAHYGPGQDAKYSPHPSPQLGGKSPRLPPQQSLSFVPQPSPHHSPSSFIGVSNATAIQPRTLHIYNTSSSQGTITDSDKTTPLYTYRTHSWSKPNLELHGTASSNNTVIGTITFHSFSSAIDLTLHNQPLPLQSNGWLASGHKFVSRAGVPDVQGELRWKDQGMSGGQVLLDQREQVLARWENSSWALSKEGKLVLLGPCAVTGPLMDEVVLTRLAEMMYRKRRNNASAAGGGGA